MIIAPLADLHIGEGPRSEESRRIRRWVIDTLRSRKPDLIAVAGDVFHQWTRPEERLEGVDFMAELASIGPVLGVPGNHDPEREVEMFNRIRALHPIRFCEKPSVIGCGDAAVALLPWMREPPTIATLRLPPAERRAAEEEATRAMLCKLGEELDARQARTRVLVSHVMLKEAAVAIGQPEARGGEFRLSLADLALVRPHVAALGHVHASQTFEINGAPVFYPGSTIRRSFGEIERKYIALIHCDGPAVSVEWIESPAAPMILASTAWREIVPGRWGFAIDEEDLIGEVPGAEVRVTYDVSEEHRAAAALAAEELVTKLRAAGAKLCKPEERVTPSARARAPEIATVSTLREKVSIALAARGITQDQPQHERALRIFDTEINTGDVRIDASDPVARLRSVRARGLGPCYAEREVFLDVDALPGEFTAITGPNGAGKSTLFEAFPGALHPQRKTPTRGTLDSLADGYGREAFVEVLASSATSTYRVRQELGRGQCFLWKDDAPIETDKGKVSKAGEWMRSTQLAPEVLTSAIYLGQRSEGLIAADGSDRRATLLRAIGVEQIELLAEKARGRVKDAKRTLEEARAEVSRLRAIPTVETTAQRHDEAAQALAAAQRSELDAQAQVQNARLALEAHLAREAERAVIGSKHGAVAAAAHAARTTVAGLERRAAEQREILADAEGIRARAARARELEGAVAARLPAAEAARADAAHSAAQALAAETACETERRRWKAAADRRKGAAARLADRAAVQEAVAQIQALTEAVEAAARRHEQADEQHVALLTALHAGVDARLTGLRGGLVAVQATTDLRAAHEVAGGALAADDVALAGEHASALKAAEGVENARFAEWQAAKAALHAAEKLAARAEDIEAAIEVERAALEEMGAAEAAGKTARLLAEKRRQDQAHAEAQRDGFLSDVEALRAEARSLVADVEKEGALAGAEVRLAEITVQLDTARTELADAEREGAALPAIPDALPSPDVNAAHQALARASRAIAEASSRVSLAARDLEVATQNAGLLLAAEEKIGHVEERHADLVLMADVLGIGGVQALEIDAAGPALSANMNELLHGSYGSRFSGEVSASRKSKDGKKTIDECEILVLDTVKKTPKRDVRTFSGGERVPLATAFFLALAVYLCRSRGLESPTLILDEPGAGLDDEHVGPWVDMLRMASRMAGASKLIVITHDKRVIEAADSVVEIRDGAVNVVR